MPYIEFVKGIPTALVGVLFWCEKKEFDRVWWSDDLRQ